MKDLDLLAAPIALIIVVSLCIGLAYFFGKAECEAKAKVLGYKCDFGIFQGCALIKPDGKVILIEQLREFNN